MEDFGVDHGGVEILKVRPENEQSQDARKQIKTLFENSVEKELLFANHVIFMTEVSHQFHLPKHVKPKVLKHLLSVFRDWKSHS